MKNLSLVSWLLLGFALLISLLGLGSHSIYILDEAKNVEAAREMWESASWFFPTFNGEPRYDKPPLHYFFFGLAFKLFGVNAFAARFFPALAGWVCSLLVFLRVRDRLGEKAANWSLGALIASLQWGIQFRLAVPDPFLILFLTATILQLEVYFSRHQHFKTHLRLASVFLGLAFLSKGPIAVVLVLGTVFTYVLFQGNYPKKSWKDFLDPISIILFCLVALPWYALVYLYYGADWLEQFIFTHNLSRFSQPMEGHGGAFYLPFLFALLGFFPASLILFLPKKNKFEGLRSSPLLVLSGIFVGVTLIFFSISSTKLPGYVAPAFPFMAVWVGWQVQGLDRVKGFSLVSFAMGIILVAAPLGVAFTKGLQERYWGEELNLTWFFVLWIAVLAAVMVRKNRWQVFVFLAVGFGGLNALLFTQVVPQLDQLNPVTLSVPFLEHEERVYFYQSFNPAFPFRLQKIIAPWSPDLAPGAIVITEKKHLDSFPAPYEEVFRAKDSFENKETVLIRQLSVWP